MNAWARFLAFLTTILGEDSTLLATLTDASPAEVDDLDLGEDHGLTDDQVEILAGLYNVDTDTVNETADALVAAAQDETIELSAVAEIADAVDGLRWVADVRAEVETAEAEQREALLSRIAPAAPAASDGDEKDDEKDEGDNESTDDDEAGDDPAVVVVVDEDEDVPVAVTAAGPRIGRVAARRTTGGENLRRQAEQAADTSAQWRMLDQVGTVGLGQRVDDDEMVESLAVRMDEIGRRAGEGVAGGVRHTFATIERDFPEDRDLTRFGKDEAGVYLEKYIKDAQADIRASSDPIGALTASGGLCTPRVPVYDIPTIAGMDRPVQSFLPTFKAERGGITFRPGRSIRTLGAIDSANSGIAVQTIARDEQGVNKPVFRVPCPATENADVSAIPARLVHGNFLERFDPEAVASAVALQGSLHARVSETNLLDLIDAASDDVQTQAQSTSTIGFARAYMVNVGTLAAGIRSRERAGATFVLDHLAPFWLLEAIRSDLALELPGSSDERLAVADSLIATFFAARNIRPGWFIDQQNMALQIDEANVSNYPTEVVSYIFEPGHHIALDGGALTLGVYRDSALNQENDAETFMETFEGLAPRGVVSYALHSDVCVTGASSAAVDVNCSLNS